MLGKGKGKEKENDKGSHRKRIQPWATLHKVPYRLREVNRKAYEPTVVSIGPYHHGRLHLEPMEIIKQRFFWEIADEIQINLNGFRAALRPLEKETRMCYQQPLPFKLESEEKFLDMMVYDGCFIVQLIRNGFEPGIFEAGYIQTDIRNDLLLLENQLPFSVLFKLYNMIVVATPGETESDGEIEVFTKLALSFFNVSPFFSPTEESIHLLQVVHSTHIPSDQGIKQHQSYKSGEGSRKSSSECTWKFIRSATELEDAGISFFGDNVTKMALEDEDINGMFDIKFTTYYTNRVKPLICHAVDFMCAMMFGPPKVLKIPTLRVDDLTERKLRNYMAYEQFFRIGKPTYFVDYVIFMDNLINTGKDVQLLCEQGIIDNRLGDHEAVAEMFNKLRESIYLSPDFYYAEIFDGVNKHCQIKWNRWKASLKKNYFNTPWSFISFIAAVVLLLLTLLQSILSILSYIKQ
ncbi:hypothetical protein like AT3G50150 [Hibiscus trionum]|uniref:Uncharacterized protein n=1 Tax=Hibiscus trionum TaxID=183268 RepID=A0A9W7J1N2_HIBTR|nr:hypothetical protein like AT3G50150 [Hibiscus trionum]